MYEDNEVTSKSMYQIPDVSNSSIKTKVKEVKSSVKIKLKLNSTEMSSKITIKRRSN